jgi:hypothetical protein
MTHIEVLEYFSGNSVYKYSGTVNQYQSYREQSGASHNYIITADGVFFVTDKVVEDPKVSVVTQEE